MQRATAYAEALAPVARCMLEAARIAPGQRVLDVGSGGDIETRESPAEELALEPGSFDVALARNCVMYFSDLGRALAGIRRALRPGGRLVASVHGPLQREPFRAIPVEAVSARRSPPDPAPDYIQAFRVDAAGVQAALVKAGFTSVRAQVVPVCRSYPDLASAIETMRTSSSLAELMSVISEHDREGAWAEIARGFCRYCVADGLRIPGEQVVVVGTV